MEIRRNDPRDFRAFAELNIHWIQELHHVEVADQQMFDHREVYADNGNSIFAAVEDDVVVGVLNPSDETSQEGGVVTDEAASTTVGVGGESTSNESTSGSSSSSTGASGTTGTNGEDIPNTGPGETVAFILLATTVLGYAISRRLQTR